MLGREPTAIPFSADAMKAVCFAWKGNGKQCKPAVTGVRSINICLPFSNSSPGGRKKERPSNVLIGRCTCEGILLSSSRNRSPPSFIARPIQKGR